MIHCVFLLEAPLLPYLTCTIILEFYDRLHAFGSGKRVCVGELLARIRMFLFVVGLMQRIQFSPAAGQPEPPYDPRCYVPGLTIRPPDYVVQIEKRKLK